MPELRRPMAWRRRCWRSVASSPAMTASARPRGSSPRMPQTVTDWPAADGFLLEDIKHKFHACCHGTHAMIEALQTLMTSQLSRRCGCKHRGARPIQRWLKVCDIKARAAGWRSSFSYAYLAAMVLSGIDTAADQSFADAVCDSAALRQLSLRVDRRGRRAHLRYRNRGRADVAAWTLRGRAPRSVHPPRSRGHRQGAPPQGKGPAGRWNGRRPSGQASPGSRRSPRAILPPCSAVSSAGILPVRRHAVHRLGQDPGQRSSNS